MRPVIVVDVAGGLPLTVVGVCAVVPMYGVTSYEVGVPPLVDAVHDTVAEFWPAVAVTFPGAPGGDYRWNATSTQ